MAEKDVAAQVRAMRSVRDFERLRAAGAFDEMTPEVVEPVLEVFGRENRRKPWRFWGSLAIGYLVVVPLASLLSLLGNDIGSICAVCREVAKRAGTGSAATRLHRRIAALLSECRNPRLAGPLTDALVMQESQSRDAIVKGLWHMLPVVAAQQPELLTSRQKRLLVAAGADGPIWFARAIVAVMSQLGDAGCREPLARLAAGGGIAKWDRRLQADAANALAHLTSLDQTERYAATLLRPAEPPADTTLLRPSASAPQGDDATLPLRAEEPVREVDAHG